MAGFMLPALMVGSSVGKGLFNMFNKPSIPKIPDYTHPYEKVGLRKVSQMRMQTENKLGKIDNRLKQSGTPESSIQAMLHKFRTESNSQINDVYSEYKSKDIEAENAWRQRKFQNDTQREIANYQHEQNAINDLFGGLMDALEIYGLQEYRDQILSELDKSKDSDDLFKKILAYIQAIREEDNGFLNLPGGAGVAGGNNGGRL